MSATRPPPSNRLWVRDLFKDHPKLAQKAPEAFSGTRETRDKPKVACKVCLTRLVNAALEQDQREIEAGTRESPRTPEMIEAELFAVDQSERASNRPWLSARTDQLLNHLIGCSNQPRDVRERASAQKEQGSARSPRNLRSRHHAEEGTGIGPILPLAYQRHSVSPYPSPRLPSLHIQSPSDAHQYQHSLAVGPSSSYERESSVASSSSSDARSVTPFDNVSIRSFPSRSSRRSSNHVPFVPPELSWSEGRQTRFEERLIRLTASAGLPLLWVENPEWLDFCVEFLPQARSPSRKVLTRRLLPQALSEFQSKAKEQMKGKTATASCDGWTGENFHHYIAFMVMADKKT
ncbi:hypothetical protein EDB84DRAFT_1440775 [Lactarius hengduanensis]|nr:hypothetical protein EDB84DRAFT_1440775 [Lactarius hengduanensis]